MPSLDDLPGHALVERGLQDVHARVRSVEALVVTAAAARLRALGIWAPDLEEIDPQPELSLYQELGRSGVADPYTRYNSLRRELTSFVRALEHRIERERRRRTDASES